MSRLHLLTNTLASISIKYPSKKAAQVTAFFTILSIINLPDPTSAPLPSKEVEWFHELPGNDWRLIVLKQGSSGYAEKGSFDLAWVGLVSNKNR
ncbi:hypothetical protein LPIBR_60161 [Lacticaseibacillus paracasei]|nr:hypothetical protein LPIBR_60161 [Lacticaseibacillus paracasei]